MWLDTIDNLEDKFILARYFYGIAEETLDDTVYSNMHRYFEANNLLPEYTSRVWSSDPVPMELLKKYNREDLIRQISFSDDKTESIPSLGSMREIEEELKPVFEPGYVSFKHDGWNMQHRYNAEGYYKISNTRARSSDPIITDNVKVTVPDKIETEVERKIISEETLSEENFRLLQNMFPKLDLKSSRASVSTALANRAASHLLHACAFAIDGVDDVTETITLLNKWGFNTPHFIRVETWEEFLSAMQTLIDLHATYPHPTDGMVYIKNRGGYLRAIRIGPWEEKVYKSFVTGYIEKPAAFEYTQSVKIFPINVGSKTHKQVNCTNWARIRRNMLQVGAPIAFIIKSDATADIDEVETRKLQAQYYGLYQAYAYDIKTQEANKKK